MRISGRTIAYLIILVGAFLIGGITFAGAQGFPTNPLPVPVEENGIIEPVTFGTGPVVTFDSCPVDSFAYEVPAGKRLIVEHATAFANSGNRTRDYRSTARVLIRTDDNDGVRNAQLVAFSREGFPVAGGGPITYYADPGDSVIFEVICTRVASQSGVIYRVAFSGRLVPVPHPSTLPTATPPP